MAQLCHGFVDVAHSQWPAYGFVGADASVDFA
jgi:hypothetical protein